MRLVSQYHPIPDDINIFPLHRSGQPLTQSLSLIRPKDRYLNRYSRLFLDLLFRYFSEAEHTSVDRVVPLPEKP